MKLPSMFTVNTSKQSRYTTARYYRRSWSIFCIWYLYFLLGWMSSWSICPWCGRTMCSRRGWWSRHCRMVEQSIDKFIKAYPTISISIQLPEQIIQLLQNVNHKISSQREEIPTFFSHNLFTKYIFIVHRYIDCCSLFGICTFSLWSC